jgi:hypothetical protein
VVQLGTSTKESSGQAIVRHEIKTFVCEGEYENGLKRILSTYLAHFDQPQQPAVWVSGFFGSGKSHLVKMLSYFWENFKFSDGVSARELKTLPPELNEQFVELSRKQDLHHSIVVRGLLSDFPSKDIRYSFLQLMLFNLGLPTKLHQFRFYYWCKTEGILNGLIQKLEAKGRTFEQELNNLYVSEYIAPAIRELKPEYAESDAQVRDQLGRNFPRVESISKEDFLYTIKSQILPLFSERIPCILVTLDEVQQFIGQDDDKSYNVQNLAEDLCGNFNGRLLLVGTGQNALAETPILQRLADRFTVKVPLSDKDVKTVTRKTVLEKKPTVHSLIGKKLEDSLGEISRLLEGSDYGFTQSDKEVLVADYPILPSTRKFWERILQAIDVAGTSGQLRSQLRIIDESVKSVANNNLGEVIPADFIFEQKKQQLIQNALLLNEQSNIMEELAGKGGDHNLKARILSVVFLIDLLPKDTQKYKLKSDKKTISDLLIDTLNEPSDHFRNKVEQLIDELVNQDRYLIPVDDEFKLQTRVGAEWERDFTAHATKYRNDDTKLFEIRQSKLLAALNERLKSVLVSQGKSKIRREITLYNGVTRPPIQEKLNLWIRDGWLENEGLLLDEVRAEGTDTALAYLFVQKTKDQELKREMVKMLAAEETLGQKGTPSTPEGEQARKSMETRFKMANLQIKDLVDDICKETKIFLAGGALIDDGDLQGNVKKALESVYARQFPEFSKADYPDWEKALRKALNNDTQALQAIGYNHEPKDHPMAPELFNFIGHAGKPGRDIRSQFSKSPYGWSQDAVDAMLTVLTIAGSLSTKEANLNQRTIAQAVFKVEEFTPSAKQKIDLRKLYQVAGINCQSGLELRCSGEFLRKLDELAESIYGDAPRPEYVNKLLVTELMNLDGNERLLAIHEKVEELKSLHERWKKESETINKRMPSWELLINLNRFAGDNETFKAIKEEIAAILSERMILHEPDPIQTPLLKLTDLLRQALNDLKLKHNSIFDEKMEGLQQNEYFQKLTPEQKREILRKYQLLGKPEIISYDSLKLLQQLNHISLEAWEDKVAALPSKFQQALEEAILLSAPKAESYRLPKRTIRNEAELEEYLDGVRKEIKDLLNNGDVILK